MFSPDFPVVSILRSGYTGRESPSYRNRQTILGWDIRHQGDMESGLTRIPLTSQGFLASQESRDSYVLSKTV